MRSVLLAILLSLPLLAQAQTPADSLKAAVAELTKLGNTADQGARVSGLCKLAFQSIDLPVVAQHLLGSTFSKMTRDTQGLTSFSALAPSLIISDFYQLLTEQAGKNFWVDTTTPQPRGSGRVGYKTYFGSTMLVVVMSKTTLKIVDAEWNNISLVDRKRDDYQAILQAEWNKNRETSMPVNALVEQILASGNVVRCN